MTGRSAQVNGRAFLGILKYIKSTRGPQAVESIIAAGNDPCRATFAQPIRMMGWYPYPAFVGFLHGLERTFGKAGQPSFCRELGDAAGARDLGTIFRVYRTLSSPERLIRACDKVWLSYYRHAGRMEAVSLGTRTTPPCASTTLPTWTRRIVG